MPKNVPERVIEHLQNGCGLADAAAIADAVGISTAEADVLLDGMAAFGRLERTVLYSLPSADGDH